MEFKKGCGWKACYDEETGRCTAERSGAGYYDLYEISPDTYARIEDGGGLESERLICKNGRRLYMDVNDRCGPPYTIVFDDEYEKLCPWANVVSSGKVWPKELTDAAVELFASEKPNREYRKKKKNEAFLKERGVEIREERISAEEYVEFLKTTDLGSQYPKERFGERIKKLVASVNLSLAARDGEGKLVGALFGLTDYSYWLFVTDLGVSREYEGRGIGSKLMRAAHAAAGGEKDIAVYLVANENAIPFYEKLGMEKADDVMRLNHIDWTEFTVE